MRSRLCFMAVLNEDAFPSLTTAENGCEKRPRVVKARCGGSSPRVAEGEGRRHSRGF
jgi:hypothetical protein